MFNIRGVILIIDYDTRNPQQSQSTHLSLSLKQNCFHEKLESIFPNRALLMVRVFVREYTPIIIAMKFIRLNVRYCTFQTFREFDSIRTPETKISSIMPKCKASLCI